MEEVAALVEYALKPGADRLDVLVASQASHVENAAAAAQLLKCACAAISSNEDPAALVFVEPPSVNRRLAATDAPTASSSTEYYSLERDPQLPDRLWTAIALISVLLSAVLFLACMRPEYDSLLYATFQANVGDHFGKENGGRWSLLSPPPPPVAYIVLIVTAESRRRTVLFPPFPITTNHPLGGAAARSRAVEASRGSGSSMTPASCIAVAATAQGRTR